MEHQRPPIDRHRAAWKGVRSVSGWESDQTQLSVMNEPRRAGASVPSAAEAIPSITLWTNDYHGTGTRPSDLPAARALEPRQRAKPLPREVEELAKYPGPAERRVGEFEGAAARETGKEEREELVVGESGYVRNASCGGGGARARDDAAIGRTKCGRIVLERSVPVRPGLVHTNQAIRLSAAVRGASETSRVRIRRTLRNVARAFAPAGEG